MATYPGVDSVDFDKIGQMVEMVSFGDGSIYCSDKHIKNDDNGLYERIHAKTTSANEITGQSMKITIHFKEYL